MPKKNFLYKNEIISNTQGCGGARGEQASESREHTVRRVWRMAQGSEGRLAHGDDDAEESGRAVSATGEIRGRRDAGRLRDAIEARSKSE
jgi:hypothetical protein